MENCPLRIERKPITWSTIHISTHLCIDSSNKHAPGLLMKNRRFSFFPRNGKSEDCFSKEKSGGCAKYVDLKMEFLFFSRKGKNGVLLINHFKSSHYTSQELCVAQSIFLHLFLDPHISTFRWRSATRLVSSMEFSKTEMLIFNS